MMDKRMTKMDVAISEIPNEDKAVAYGSRKHSHNQLGLNKGYNIGRNGQIGSPKA